MLGVFGKKGFDSSDKSRQRGFHIRGAAAIQHAVADGGRKRFAIPFFDWAGWHHVGVPGKANHRAASPFARPKIIDIAEAHFVDFKTEFLQAFN